MNCLIKRKRIVSVFLSLVIVLCSIYLAPIQSKKSNAAISANEDICTADNLNESRIDCENDLFSGSVAGNWGEAIYKYGLPWNVFHNAVQNKIVDTNNTRKIYKELTVDFYRGKRKGRYGRVDLYLKESDYIYVWEVKPLSYNVAPNRKIAMKQLNEYIYNSKPRSITYRDYNFKLGSVYPSSSKLKLSGETEVKGFKVIYKYSGDGIILYKFYKDDEKENNPQEALAASKEQQKEDEKNYAAGLVNAALSRPISDEELEDLKDRVRLVLAIARVVVNYGAVAPGIRETSIGDACRGEGWMLVEQLSAYLKKKIVTIAEANAVRSLIDKILTFIRNMFGNDIGRAVMQAASTGSERDREDAIKRIREKYGKYEEAGNAQPPRDPLIIDLGDEGIELKSVEHGVNFDLDNNGFAEKTAWIGGEDGFLALDRNGNEKIDNGGELFGDQVKLKNGEKSSSGFDALKELDEDDNKVIDKDDESFDKLLVWIDANHNGKSEKDELKKLSDLNIVSVSTQNEIISVVDEETGARIAETSDVKYIKNDVEEITKISEFWFPINSSDTQHGDVITSGNVKDIESAISSDESGELKTLVDEFTTSRDIKEKRLLVKKILYKLTGAESVASGSRGGNIDARDLRVVEQFMGREFEGVDGSSNPNVNAANILKDIYSEIEDIYYYLVNTYSVSHMYIKMINEYTEDEKVCLNMSLLYYMMDQKIEDGYEVDSFMYDIAVYLRIFDRKNGTKYYDEFKEHYSNSDNSVKNAVEMAYDSCTYLGTDASESYTGTGKNDFIYGLGGGDSLNGSSGNDVIDGGEGSDSLAGASGNDAIYGSDGNDTLDGGEGKDTLEGGDDDDVYIFAKGYGKDTVCDYSGANTIRFKGLKLKDVKANGVSGTDAVIYVKGTSDSITIQNYLLDDGFKNFKLQFEDKTVNVDDSDSPFKHIYGGNDEDVLQALVNDSYMHGFGGDDVIIGSDGKDVIYGNAGNDYISAEMGDDKVIAGVGDDEIDAGEGDDIIYGGAGDDVFIFGKGYGTDVISDDSGASTISVRGEYGVSEIKAYSMGSDCVLTLKGGDDRLILEDALGHIDDYIISVDENDISLSDLINGSEDEDSSAANMIFDGNNEYDYYENREKEFLSGGKSGDRILGCNLDEYIFGNEGDDQLLTAEGDDVVFGGKGKDYINAGNGNDYIDPGSGNDFLDSGKGDDTYVFRAGYGTDSIFDSDGKNTIIFGDGFESDRIKAYRDNWNDLKLTFENSEDELIIKNYCINEDARDFELIFADGTIVNATDKDSPLRTIYGTDGSEYMISIYDDGVNKVGQAGDDQLVGSKGNDSLYGGNGNDRMTGLAGDDVLDGGEGNDFLYGDAGNDTYIFRRGYGKDTIGDDKGNNVINIVGHSKNEIKAYRTNWNNLTIKFVGSDDEIILENFYVSGAYRNYTLIFNGYDSVQAMAGNSPLRTVYCADYGEYTTAVDDGGVSLIGGKGYDNLNGGSGNDRLFGNDSDDTLNGNAGNDYLDGGSGNDMLYGGKGNDTYFFAKGYGKDRIIDTEGKNVIEFGKGFSEEKLILMRTDWNDLTISFKGNDDRLVVTGFYVNEGARNVILKFADGTNILLEEKLRKEN